MSNAVVVAPSIQSQMSTGTEFIVYYVIYLELPQEVVVTLASTPRFTLESMRSCLCRPLSGGPDLTYFVKLALRGSIRREFGADVWASFIVGYPQSRSR